MQGHDNHQLAKPDTSFISTLQRSHPGCKIAVLTDQATQIDLPEGVRLFRYTIDRSKLGRNAYANYYQYLAQVTRAIWDMFSWCGVLVIVLLQRSEGSCQY
jgi:hypothetical protein